MMIDKSRLEQLISALDHEDATEDECSSWTEFPRLPTEPGKYIVANGHDAELINFVGDGEWDKQINFIPSHWKRFVPPPIDPMWSGIEKPTFDGGALQPLVSTPTLPCFRKHVEPHKPTWSDWSWKKFFGLN